MLLCTIPGLAATLPLTLVIAKQRLNVQHPVGIDLVFMYDRSSSIAPSDFAKGISFAEFILDELGVANKTGEPGDGIK